MKKLFLPLASLLLLFSLTACGGEQQPTATPDSSTPPPTASQPLVSQPSDDTPPEETPTESDAPETGGKNILVAYFSWSGNTRTVAEAIQSHLDTAIFEIATVNGYSEDYDTVLDEAQAEQRENARPELNAQVEDMDGYDVIFLGYPNWWGDMPMALYTFLDTYDLSGKTVIPFVTSGGSGFSRTVSAIETAEPDATLLDGLALSGDGVDNAGVQIEQWLDGLALSE